MGLMSTELIKKMPKIYSTENLDSDEKIAMVKFFNPCGAGTWYGIEYDPDEKLFFGFVDLFCKEYGYFSLDELESIELPFGLKIERDMWFEPTPMSVIESL